MASIISAGTTSGTALNMAGDTSGVLQLATNGSTTALTIDTSQNVGIGTTSPATKLELKGSTEVLRLTTTGDVTSSGTVYQRFNDVNGNAAFIGYGGGPGGAFEINNSKSAPMLFVNNAAERMRIDSSGNVGIGTASPSYPLQVSGTMLQGGQWGVFGAHNANGGYPVPNDIGVAFAWNFTAGGRDACLMNNDTSGGGFRFVQRTGAATNNFNARSDANGIWFQGNNSSTWSTTSDARIKTNVREINGALDKINALHPCHFEYIDKVGKIKTGFIAQEFETVFSGHVNTEKFVPEEYKDVIPEGEGIKGIDADLIPYLTKAIQEQQTIINDLKARITALEGAA
jgi:hypothetical protein